MRRAALSMVAANMRQMGCRYPSAVEEEVARTLPGLAARHGARGQPASGLAVEGEMRAAAAQAALRSGAAEHA